MDYAGQWRHIGETINCMLPNPLSLIDRSVGLTKLFKKVLILSSLSWFTLHFINSKKLNEGEQSIRFGLHFALLLGVTIDHN